MSFSGCLGLVLEKSERETSGRSQTMSSWANIHKGMTPPSTQNLKTLNLRVYTTYYENPRGKPWGDLTRMRTEPTYKGMTPPSTQNLKALGLWVFFLIYCSTFSFLPNVGLRLTLEYISPSSESPSSTLIHYPQEDFQYRVKLYSLKS